MQIRFFVPTNLQSPIETIQADVIPPIGSLIRFPNGSRAVATRVQLELPHRARPYKWSMWWFSSSSEACRAVGVSVPGLR